MRVLARFYLQSSELKKKEDHDFTMILDPASVVFPLEYL